jgi:hypothetical protein
MKNFDDDDTYEFDLRELSAKLRGVAYLIESFDEEAGPPLDSKTIYWGIGMILTEISESVLKVAQSIGAKKIKKPKNSRVRQI